MILVLFALYRTFFPSAVGVLFLNFSFSETDQYSIFRAHGHDGGSLTLHNEMPMA